MGRRRSQMREPWGDKATVEDIYLNVKHGLHDGSMTTADVDAHLALLREMRRGLQAEERLLYETLPETGSTPEYDRVDLQLQRLDGVEEALVQGRRDAGRKNPVIAKLRSHEVLRERWGEGTTIVIEHGDAGYIAWLESQHGNRLPISFGRDRPSTAREALEIAKRFLRRVHGKTNPSEIFQEDVDDAIDKYKEFHRLDPRRLEEITGLAIPSRVRKIGAAKYVLYRSGKRDPVSLRKPARPVDYIHEHDAGVMVYETTGKADTDVPEKYRSVTALVQLGKCLGFGLRDGTEASGTDPLPDLCCTPDGKCLLVVQGKRKVLAMMWGGALGVFARGIDG